MEEKENVALFDDPDKVTGLMIGLILIIIILSQSFAINNNLGAIEIFRNILNHNSIYLFMLLYFVALKTYLGKKYFNYINAVVIFIYFINMITSLLTIFHSFSLSSLLGFALNFVLFLYLFHVFFRGTRIWKDFKLKKSPFNELSNDWYFSVIVIIAVMSLAVNLIFTTTFDGTVLALLDCLYVILFTRYIFLYRNYLDSKRIDAKNEGNLDEVKTKISDVADGIGEAICDIAEDVSESVNKFIDDNNLDEKINNLGDKMKEVGDNAASKLDEVTDKFSEKVEEIVSTNETKEADKSKKKNSKKKTGPKSKDKKEEK